MSPALQDPELSQCEPRLEAPCMIRAQGGASSLQKATWKTSLVERNHEIMVAQGIQPQWLPTFLTVGMK